MTLIEGAGIGLALVREAAQAVGGRVQLISEPGHGCTFNVYLPAQAEADAATPQHSPFQSTERLALDAALLDEGAQDEVNDAPASATQPSHGETLGTLLLVEDNRDLRDYLTSLLSRDWAVVPAVHGEEALERLEDHAIDVIVSDIMMPRMDGLELLQRVRGDLRTSHIPFLILSARRDAETRIAGLSMAADDFLTKPFDATELRLKLRNMAERRRSQTHQLRQELQTQAGQSAGGLRLSADTSATPSASALSPRDHRFAERVKQWLAQHHDNAECTIAEMARDLAVDQRTLQRKIKALFDCAPSECLNEYRINKAQAALLESAQSIQEIAYDCGFNSPKSFSRTFQRHLGCSPSAWRNQHAA
jgi:YesN/AraC family two-component response regulator